MDELEKKLERPYLFDLPAAKPIQTQATRPMPELDLEARLDASLKAPPLHDAVLPDAFQALPGAPDRAWA
jgi:hypothetical protein